VGQDVYNQQDDVQLSDVMSDDYDASSLLSYGHSELSFADSQHSAFTKPWFIRTLPSRLELVEGRSVAFHCRTSGTGCRPWFIKRLPARVEVERGHEINMDCAVASVTDESLELGSSRSSAWILEQKMKKGVQGMSVCVVLTVHKVVVTLCPLRTSSVTYI